MSVDKMIPIFSEKELQVATEWKEGSLFGFFYNSSNNLASSRFMKRKYFYENSDEEQDSLSRFDCEPHEHLDHLNISGDFKKPRSLIESYSYGRNDFDRFKSAQFSNPPTMNLSSQNQDDNYPNYFSKSLGTSDEIWGWKMTETRQIFVPRPEDMEFQKKTWYSEYVDIDSKDCIWNTNFDAVLLYGKEKGHCNVPRALECRMPNGAIVKLGLWLSNQRARKKACKLRPDRLEKMERIVNDGKLNWFLDRREVNTDNERWDMMFFNLVDYGNANGHCNVPQSLTVYTDGNQNNPLRIGEWLSRQRSSKRANTLIPEREERLQALVDKGWFQWDMTIAL